MTGPESRDEAGPVLDLLGDLDTREQRRTEASAGDVEPTLVESGARRWWPFAAAAAVLLIAATVFAPSTGEDDGATAKTVDPAPRPSIAPAPSTTAHAPSTTAEPRFIPGLYPDLPPAGATPSSPHPGELVAAVTRIHAGAWYLYADGRLIWIVDYPPSPDFSFVEQRLTPAGVERVRSEFVSTGLFDPAQPTTEVAASDLPFGIVRVRDGGRLLSAHLSAREADAHREVSRLVQYFMALDSSLPPELWADRQIKEYVASRYEFCVSRVSSESTHDALPDPSEALALLPARAAEVLGDRQATQREGISGPVCFEVTRDEAGALGGEIIRSGWTFDVTQPTPMTVSLSIWALLPHGVPAIWGG